MRLLTRNGIDWSGRFPLIAAAAGDLKVRSCLIDGEAVACDGDGLPSFDRLRYRRQDSTVFLYAFDLLGIRDRGGCAPLRHSRRVGVGIERCAVYATDNQESEPRGIKKSPFSLCDCLCSGILSLGGADSARTLRCKLSGGLHHAEDSNCTGCILGDAERCRRR
jgi:hypothetical protein